MVVISVIVGDTVTRFDIVRVTNILVVWNEETQSYKLLVCVGSTGGWRLVARFEPDDSLEWTQACKAAKIRAETARSDIMRALRQARVRAAPESVTIEADAV
jgi:hypothetical protein